MSNNSPATPEQMIVHNHGPEEGAGLCCHERRIDGRLVGDCLLSAADELHYWLKEHDDVRSVTLGARQRVMLMRVHAALTAQATELAALRAGVETLEAARWFGNAGHLIVGRWCRFHLCTAVNGYLVSTVGEYWPERRVREIHAEVHAPHWLAKNGHLNGDAFDDAYFARFGFETIGSDRTYETMVFRAGAPCTAEGCGCGLPAIDGSELDFAGYNDAAAATTGHMEMVAKFADRVPRQPTEGQ